MNTIRLFDGKNLPAHKIVVDKKEFQKYNSAVMEEDNYDFNVSTTH